MLWVTGLKSEKIYFLKQQVCQVTMEYPVIIIEVVGNIQTDHNFFKEIFCQKQRGKFRGFLFICVHPEGRLDINFPVRVINHKINFFLDIPSVRPVRNDSDINGLSPPNQFIIDDVLHDMAWIVLSVIQPCVSKPDVRIVIFIRVLEICLSFYIVASGH